MMTGTMKKFFCALIRFHIFFFMMLLGLTLDNSIFAMQANEISQSTHHQKIQQIIKEYFNNNQKNRLRGIAQLKRDLVSFIVNITDNTQNPDSFLEELKATFQSKNISHIFILILQSHQKALPDRKEDTALKALDFLIENFPKNVLITGSNDFLQFLCKSSEKEDFSLSETCKQKQKELIAVLGNKNTPHRPMQENGQKEPKILERPQTQSPAKRVHNNSGAQKTQKFTKTSDYSTPFSSNNNNNSNNNADVEIIEIDDSLTQERMPIQNNTNLSYDSNINIFNNIIIDNQNPCHNAIKEAVDNYFYSENNGNRFCPSVKEDLKKLICFIADHYPFESQKEFVKKIENEFKYKVLQQILITILTSYKRIKSLNKEIIALKGLTFLKQVIPNKIVFVNKQNFNYFKKLLDKKSPIFSHQCQEKKDSILKALEQYESCEDQANNASSDYEIGKNSDSSQEYYKNDDNQINSDRQADRFVNLDWLIGDQSSPFIEMGYNNFDETNYQHINKTHFNQNNNSNWPQEPFYQDPKENDVIEQKAKKYFEECKKRNRKSRLNDYMQEDLINLLRTVINYTYNHQKNAFTEIIKYLLELGSEIGSIISSMLSNQSNIKQESKKEYFSTILTFLEKAFPDNVTVRSGAPLKTMIKALNAKHFRFDGENTQRVKNLIEILQKY